MGPYKDVSIFQTIKKNKKMDKEKEYLLEDDYCAQEEIDNIDYLIQISNSKQQP